MITRLLAKFILLVMVFASVSQLSMATTHTKHHTTTKKLHSKTNAKHKTHHTVHQQHHKTKIHHKNKHTTKHPVTAHAKSRPHIVMAPNSEPIEIVDTKTIAQSPATAGFVASIEQGLVDFAHKTVTNLRYSAYKLGGTLFDTARGVYVVDCSSYVDHILKAVYPEAYSSLVDSSGSPKPNSQHYYDFFTSLSYDPDDYWHKVDDVKQLQPGDILVFRYKNSLGAATGGHVMVVMDKPIFDTDAFLVRVADSAPVGHSEDTRPGRVSGIGIGTLLLKVSSSNGKPYAYAWKDGARWKGNVNFAMARPVSFENNGVTSL